MKLTLPAGSVEDLGGGVVRVTLPGTNLSDTVPEADAGSGDAGTATAASRGDHAHPLAIWDLNTVLAYGNDAGGTPIVGLPDPTDDQDAATKKYVDDNAPTFAAVLAAGNDTGGVLIVHNPPADETANLDNTATATGTGNASNVAQAIAPSGENAYAGSLATAGAVSAGMMASVTAGVPRLAFNGATLVAIPEVPAVPTVQDVVDAFVALGLITQAAP